MNIYKIVKNIFFVLVCLSVSSALWVFKDLLFPFVTSKAFFFRITIELALPFYLYLIISESKLRPSFKNPLNVLYIVFLVLNTVSSFTGNNTVRSLWGNFERMGGAFYIGHLTALYFYILLIGQMQRQYLQNFLKCLLFFAFIVAGNGIFGWLGLPTFVLDPSLPIRVSSTLGNPIYLGSFLILPLFLSLFLSLQTDSRFQKIVYWITAFVFACGIFLSGTRGARVGLIVSIFISALVYIYFSNNKKVKIHGASFILLFVVMVGVLFVFGKSLPNGSVLQRLVKLKDSNSDARLLQWKVALEGYKDRPLFGTGPENYYVVANKYYNPEIYKYDRSWFDKPHNYILEILVTSGMFGFVAYLGILIFIIFSLYYAYKAEFFGLLEFCILLAGFLAYQIQNLFVFDTVPASLTFYSFMGFVGYLWHISKEHGVLSESKSRQIKSMSHSFSGVVLIISMFIVSYTVYATNVVPIQISKNVNYGYAYANVDKNKSNDYFETAMSLPFNFDKTETASKYADVVTGWARNANDKNQSFVVENLQNSIGYMQSALETQPDNPILWQRLVSLYLYKGVQTKGGYMLDSRAEDAVNKAVLLAPQREESYLNRAQILGIKGDLAGAQKVLESAQLIFPTDTNLQIQLSNIFKAQGKTADAVKIYEKILSSDYAFGSYTDLKWLVDYYVTKNEFAKAITICEKFAKTETNNIQIFIDLAHLYVSVGRNTEAVKIAQSIMNFDQTKKVEMQQLIDAIAQKIQK